MFFTFVQLLPFSSISNIVLCTSLVLLDTYITTLELNKTLILAPAFVHHLIRYSRDSANIIFKQNWKGLYAGIYIRGFKYTERQLSRSKIALSANELMQSTKGSC